MLTAEVKNTGKDVSAAVFKATISDKDGKRLGTADGAIMKMKKGESKTVDFASLDDLKGYAKFKFQIDSAV
jgi:hypothetical protein